MSSSSDDLCPATGARYLFERSGSGYRARVFRAGGERWELSLSWDSSGSLTLDPEPADAAVAAELVKLARVVQRTRQARLSRWRA